MSWIEQKYFFLSHTSTKKPDTPKNRENDVNEGKYYTRSKTITYFLVNENGEKTSVCKTFFLTTLGYNQNNCKAVRNALESGITTTSPNYIQNLLLMDVDAT